MSTGWEYRGRLAYEPGERKPWHAWTEMRYPGRVPRDDWTMMSSGGDGPGSIEKRFKSEEQARAWIADKLEGFRRVDQQWAERGQTRAQAEIITLPQGREESPHEATEAPGNTHPETTWLVCPLDHEATMPTAIQAADAKEAALRIAAKQSVATNRRGARYVVVPISENSKLFHIRYERPDDRPMNYGSLVIEEADVSSPTPALDQIPPHPKTGRGG